MTVPIICVFSCCALKPPVVKARFCQNGISYVSLKLIMHVNEANMSRGNFGQMLAKTPHSHFILQNGETARMCLEEV